MQEVLRYQLEDLVRDCTDFGWIGVGREDGKDTGEYHNLCLCFVCAFNE